jgi:hypothetical protein
MIIVESSLPKTVASTGSNCAKGVRVRTIRFSYIGAAGQEAIAPCVL